MLKASEVLERNYHEGVLPKITASGSSFRAIERGCAVCQLAMPFCEKYNGPGGGRYRYIVVPNDENIFSLVSKSYGMSLETVYEIGNRFESKRYSTLEISEWLKEQGY